MFWGRAVRFVNACLVVLLFLPSAQVFAGEPQWIEVRSPNFSVITDAGEKRGRDVALHFEQMRSVFGRLLTKANVNLPVPLQIVAFRSTKQIRQVAPIFNGKPTEVAGLFQGGEDRSFIMLDMAVENPWQVVFHEYAHRLMDGNLSFQTDPWFEEGFAEYFSSIEVDSKEARVGKIPEETYQILQQMGMMKVSDLFRVQQYSKTYNENGDHRTTFYAESGLMVHYLYDNLLIPKLADYFDTLQLQKKPVDQSIQVAFGMTPEQFDKALRGYLNSGRYRYYPVPTPADIVPAQFTISPVSTADAAALLADIHAHSPDHRGQAMGEFQAVLQSDANNAAALRGIGYLYLQQRDLEHAAEYFKRAAQLDSKDPRVHYYYAMLLNQGGRTDEAKSAEIKKELEEAIALDPKLADAYSLLGFAQASSGEQEKGIATMKKAIELSPRSEHYQFNLANVYMMSNKVDDAIAMFRVLAASSNPQLAQLSSDALAQAQEFKEQSKRYEPRVESRSAGAPQLQTARNEQPAAQETTASSVIEVERPAGPIRFVKGKIASMDCSSAGAIVVVASAAKSVKIHIPDRAHVTLIGPDSFSCDWKGRAAGVNYRERPDGDGDVVSLEIH
jgi:tetratricopeptide (TPR) repeat protein